MDIKSQIINLISHGKIEKALEIFSKYLKENRSYLSKEITIISNTYYTKKRDHSLGLIGESTYINQSANAILSLLDRFEDHLLKEEELKLLKQRAINATSELELRSLAEDVVEIENSGFLYKESKDLINMIEKRLKEEYGIEIKIIDSEEDSTETEELSDEVKFLIKIIKNLGISISLSFIIYAFLGSILISVLFGVIIGLGISIFFSES